MKYATMDHSVKFPLPPFIRRGFGAEVETLIGHAPQGQSLTMSAHDFGFGWGYMGTQKGGKHDLGGHVHSDPIPKWFTG